MPRSRRYGRFLRVLDSHRLRTEPYPEWLTEVETDWVTGWVTTQGAQPRRPCGWRRTVRQVSSISSLVESVMIIRSGRRGVFAPLGQAKRCHSRARSMPGRPVIDGMWQGATVSWTASGQVNDLQVSQDQR
jgi:hypothetical protein